MSIYTIEQKLMIYMNSRTIFFNLLSKKSSLTLFSTYLGCISAEC